MHNDLDDGALVARMALGDHAACEILVRRHIRSATLFAAQLLGDRDDAEDVVQAAFILACERAAELDSNRPFAPWLFGVVRRLAFKMHARRARRRSLWQRWQSGNGRWVDPATEFEAASDFDIVRRELATLTPMQRACFELVVLRDLPVDDVAAMYEIGASTVRQHVFRARRELRARLATLLGPAADRWTRAESGAE